MGRLSYGDLDEALRHHWRDGVLYQAMEPGGVDAWARVDRKIPGDHHGWVIVPREHDGYQPGALTLRDDTVINAIERLQGSETLEDLNCTPEFIDKVDAVLGYGDASIFDFEPAVAAQIVQIGLFGSVWYS